MTTVAPSPTDRTSEAIRVRLRNRVFEIREDEHSWMVAELKKRVSGEHVGEDCLDEGSRSYFLTIPAVASHLLEYSLRKADAESLRELVEISRELRAEIRALFEERPDKTPRLAGVAGRK